MVADCLNVGLDLPLRFQTVFARLTTRLQTQAAADVEPIDLVSIFEITSMTWIILHARSFWLASGDMYMCRREYV